MRTTVLPVILLATALPLAASAATTSQAPPQTFNLATRYYDTSRAGEIDGTMKITVYASGIVNGSYQLADGGRSNDVTGGMQGKNIWLDIGGIRHSLHLTGTFQDGVLQAVSSEEGPGVHVFQSTNADRVGA